MRKPKKHTVLPKGDYIKALLAELAWDYSELVRQSGVKRRTIENAVSGRVRIEFENIAAIAKALGKDWNELVQDANEELTILNKSHSGEKPISERRIPGIIIRCEVEIPPDISDPRVLEFMKHLSAAFGALSPLIILAISAGSIILTLSVTEEDVLRMVDAFCKGSLDIVNARTLTIPLTKHMTRKIMRAGYSWTSYLRWWKRVSFLPFWKYYSRDADHKMEKLFAARLVDLAAKLRVKYRGLVEIRFFVSINELSLRRWPEVKANITERKSLPESRQFLADKDEH